LKLIFNTSMPRAGSELLQVILHQNPRIYASPTSPLLEFQFAARQNYDLPEVRSQDPKLMQAAFIAMCRGMAESYYEAITDRPVVCDKNRGWSHYFEWVQQWSPDPKMICMVRDLRSILASMERIYRKNRHRPLGPDNPAQIANMTVAQRCGYWLHTQPVGLAMQRTADLFQRGLDKKILFVRYEDLCSSPQGVMDSLYGWIAEETFVHDFEHLEKQVAEDDSHFGPYGQHSVLPAIRPVKPKDWAEMLPTDVAEGIRRENAWYFTAFGY
jgi:sulfotransferase